MKAQFRFHELYERIRYQVDSLTTVFHLSSFVGFAILVIFLIKIQALTDFASLLMQSLNNTNQRVTVDWPDKFFLKFMSVMKVMRIQSPVQNDSFKNCLFTNNLPIQTKPCKINARVWLDFSARFGIESWQIESTATLSENLVVSLKVRLIPEDPTYWQNQLSEGLGRQIEVWLR